MKLTIPPKEAMNMSNTVATSTKTNVLAIIALITGILSMAIVPVILGHIALGQIKKTGEQGRVMAIVGLVLGYLGVAVWVIVVIAISIAASVPGAVTVTSN
jgi:hypothetical protein